MIIIIFFELGNGFLYPFLIWIDVFNSNTLSGVHTKIAPTTMLRANEKLQLYLMVVLMGYFSLRMPSSEIEQ